MIIAGGLYKEYCYVPKWLAEFGSGGRAAAAVSKLSPGSELFTYAEKNNRSGIKSLTDLGVQVQASETDSTIAFVYFHPLSTPHVEPSPESLTQLPSLQVSGSAVLRFGFLEGDAIVTANRAVYDPQTSKGASMFHENGSSADELAIVLNAKEVREMSGFDDLDNAAISLMRSDQASCLIVKDGVRGATLYESDKKHHIAAYKTERVFKIGTGDVFSAAFTLFWAERQMSALEAANMASQRVAQYCNNATLPMPSLGQAELEPVSGTQSGVVLVEGQINTLGRRYIMEESCARLQELGVRVNCPSIEENRTTHAVEPSAIYLIVSNLNKEIKEIFAKAKAARIATVVFNETGEDWEQYFPDNSSCQITDDFTTSMYLVAWAAMQEKTISS